MPSSPFAGRHEHGQNFLTDHATIEAIVGLIARTDGPIVEIGPGDGAVTRRVLRLGRDLTAVEIDPRRAAELRRIRHPRLDVVNRDVLHHSFPAGPHVVVGNLPFHLTTAILRRLLHAPGWTDAVLLVQWEVARRRAGVGGASMMTSQWAPWFDFAVHRRVPARAFTPQPGVNGGLMTVTRRREPLLPGADRKRFQAMVHRVYTGRGNGLAHVLPRAGLVDSPRSASRWLAGYGLRPSDLPKALPVDAWVDLYRTSGSSPPRRRSDPRKVRVERNRLNFD